MNTHKTLAATANQALTAKGLHAVRICTEQDETARIYEGLSNMDGVLNRLQERIVTSRLSLPELNSIYALMCTILAEMPPYRFETALDAQTREPSQGEVIHEMRARRERAADLLALLFQRTEFKLIQHELESLRRLVFSCLDPQRYMPFRVIQVGKISDELFVHSIHLYGHSRTVLRSLHSMKYPRFGTSGWRGRWRIDFDEYTAKCVAQAICDFVNGRNVPPFVASADPGASDRGGKPLIVGYDSRAHARRVAEWVAHVANENDLDVCLTSRDTPTPALAYWAVEVLGENAIAGIVNCTASHNPVEWQGIKFSPFNGVPAPTAVTDFLAARANRLKIERRRFPKTPRGYARRSARVVAFDPRVSYCEWLLSPNKRGITIDGSAMRSFFHGRRVVIDEMHGTSRGYLTAILRRLGVPHVVIHGEKSQRRLEELHYASPEWPFIAPLMDAVKTQGAIAGAGCDTDADRFGVVDELGRYVKPNQVLPLLTTHLLKRGFRGKVLRTVTGSRLIDRIVQQSDLPRQDRPNQGVLPAYIGHAFHRVVRGNPRDFRGLSVFLEPVGIKYVIEGMLIDSNYRLSFQPGFRDTLLLGGEESSGLTTISHIPDKDGIWGNLLVLHMMALEKKSLSELWKSLESSWGTWWFERLDVDAGDQAKERLLDFFFHAQALQEFAGLPVTYIGAVRYDFAEVQLAVPNSDRKIFFELRASGTEPINRVYVEAPSESLGRQVQEEILRLLDVFSAEEIASAPSIERLASVLCVCEPKRQARAALDRCVRRLGRGRRDRAIQQLSVVLRDRVDAKMGNGRVPYLEYRSQQLANEWLALLSPS